MDNFFKKKRNVVFTAIFYTFLWGCAFPLVKTCMESFQILDTDNISKCLIAGIRFSLSGVLALLWCFFTEDNRLRINRLQIKSILLYGIMATALQYSFTYIALSKIEGSKGAVYDQLCVFIIVLTSGIFFKSDKLNLKKIIGCIIGFSGVALINIDGFSFSFDIAGEGIMLGAVICQSLAYFVAKNAADKISAPKLVGYGQLIGGILLCIFSVLNGGRINYISAEGVTSLVLLILLSAVAYILSLMPLKHFPASEVSSFNLLITVFGVIMSSVMLHEDIFKWNYALSLIFISVGIVLINSKRNSFSVQKKEGNKK